jgi:hypothetical protein
MTRATIRTYPTPKVLHSVSGFITTPGDPRIFDFSSYVLSQFPSLGDGGLSGYAFVLKNFLSPFDNSSYIAGIVGLTVMLDTADATDMDRLWAPVVEHVNATWPGITYFSIKTTFPSVWEWFKVNKDNTAAGGNSYVGSRLLDKAALTNNVTALAEAYESFTGDGIGTAYLVSGKGVWNAKPRGGSNAVSPGWRSAYVHASKLHAIEYPY